MSKLQFSSPELKKEIEREIPKIGPAEWELACQTASDSKNLDEFKRKVADALEEFRLKIAGPTTGTTAFEYKTEQGWLEYYNSIETDARKELLASSAELKTLDKLQRDTLEAERRAKQKELELTKLFDDFCSLPGKADSINRRLADVRTTREALSETSLTTKFRQLYTEGLAGTASAFGFADQVALALLTSRLRIEVLNEQEVELTASLAKLQEDDKRLSKALGRPRQL
jgi:hypothetical protein